MPGLGENLGVSLGGGFDTWTIDGEEFGTLVDGVATYRSLEARFRATRSELLNQLRQMESNAGKVDVLPMSDGSFVAVDRTDDGSNTFNLVPPFNRRPLRVSRYSHTSTTS